MTEVAFCMIFCQLVFYQTKTYVWFDDHHKTNTIAVTILFAIRWAKSHIPYSQNWLICVYFLFHDWASTTLTVQVSCRVNNMQKCAHIDNNDARKVTFSLVDGWDGDKHNGVGFREIFSKLSIQDEFFFGKKLFDSVEVNQGQEFPTTCSDSVLLLFRKIQG